MPGALPVFTSQIFGVFDLYPAKNWAGRALERYYESIWLQKHFFYFISHEPGSSPLQYVNERSSGRFYKY